MTEQQKKQKEIAVAFATYFLNDYGVYDRSISYQNWLLTEEGKRLTVEEPDKDEEVRWLRAADIKALKTQLDRIEGNMKVTKG